MGWTKRELIEQAYNLIGMGSNAYTMTPEDYLSGCILMDSLVASWEPKFSMGYPMADSPRQLNLDAEIKGPPSAPSAIFTNLAILLAPTIGKSVGVEIIRNAESTFEALLASLVTLEPRSIYDGLPSGEGNKPWRRRCVAEQETIDRVHGGDAIKF